MQPEKFSKSAGQTNSAEQRQELERLREEQTGGGGGAAKSFVDDGRDGRTAGQWVQDGRGGQGEELCLGKRKGYPRTTTKLLLRQVKFCIWKNHLLKNHLQTNPIRKME